MLVAFLGFQVYNFIKRQQEFDNQISSLQHALAKPSITVSPLQVSPGLPKKESISKNEFIQQRRVSDDDLIDDKAESNKAQEMTEKIKNLDKIIGEVNNFDEKANHRDNDNFSSRSSTKKKNEYPITRICLTGGPCAGKTTALTELTLVLQQMGFRVLQVPEAATIMKKGGALITTHKMSFA